MLMKNIINIKLTSFRKFKSRSGWRNLWFKRMDGCHVTNKCEKTLFYPWQFRPVIYINLKSRSSFRHSFKRKRMGGYRFFSVPKAKSLSPPVRKHLPGIWSHVTFLSTFLSHDVSTAMWSKVGVMAEAEGRLLIVSSMRFNLKLEQLRSNQLRKK